MTMARKESPPILGGSGGFLGWRIPAMTDFRADALSWAPRA